MQTTQLIQESGVNGNYFIEDSLEISCIQEESTISELTWKDLQGLSWLFYEE